MVTCGPDGFCDGLAVFLLHVSLPHNNNFKKDHEKWPFPAMVLIRMRCKYVYGIIYSEDIVWSPFLAIDIWLFVKSALFLLDLLYLSF